MVVTAMGGAEEEVKSRRRTAASPPAVADPSLSVCCTRAAREHRRRESMSCMKEVDVFFRRIEGTVTISSRSTKKGTARLRAATFIRDIPCVMVDAGILFFSESDGNDAMRCDGAHGDRKLVSICSFDDKSGSSGPIVWAEDSSDAQHDSVSSARLLEVTFCCASFCEKEKLFAVTSGREENMQSPPPSSGDANGSGIILIGEKRKKSCFGAVMLK
mmetsp:Transcript_5949/g.7717  ORF Transcript_5949/g.7717 Transcript_5949/m.7717 type:complete len:216 (-) Transcript_5949:12-659(-)